MAGRLAIPFIGPRGNVYDIRFRCIEDHDHKDSEVRCPKYLGSDGVETRMFNTRALLAPTDYIFVCEGELDAATLTACGWPAVGIPGAHAWKLHYSRMLAGFSRVILVADADEAGKKLAVKFRKALPSSGSVILCKYENARDVNEVFVQYGKDGLAALLRGEDDE
jgi:DNA primase